ncbi:phage tail protein [Pukyongiella litopenaei]|uniref:Phage tail protein n=1 Tax=Pukyongiella litopenaei TaxID=2605946 RepID=A0A5C2H3U3_9RHOB|nr:phage tail protein [Pukyongiella litopenaei]QEP30305.1 phage tail protein [Pukyongiella litopenaei]
MLGFDIDDGRLEAVAREYAATPKQVELSQGRALKRTAGTLRRLSSKGLKSELGLRNATALRRRIKDYRVGKGGNALKLWYGANDLPVSAFKGRPQPVTGGVKFGSTMIHGAFFARLGGRRLVMQRHGSKRWQIGEATLPVADRMMIYLEDEVFVDIDSIYFKHFLAEVRARTILGVG